MNMFFYALGIASCLSLLVIVIVFIVVALKEKVSKWTYRQQIKHRFDKPPLAKCYCVDCTSYRANGDCRAHDGWTVADCWYCWAATPKERQDK